MTVHLDRAADEATACWLCHGCGERYPMDGPAYPACDCGQRCRMVDAVGVPFVGSPDDRLASARAEAEKALAQWQGDLDFLRACLDEGGPDEWWSRNAPRAWSSLGMAAAYTSHTAEHLDRVEAEVARMRGEA